MTTSAPSDPPLGVVVHSSWSGLLGASLGALVLLGAGAVGVVLGGWRVIPTGLFVLGVLFVATVVFDYPVATAFDADGLTRRMLLRRHRILWDRVDQLTRSRPGFTAGLRGTRHGGLTAVVGRRRILLVDQPESPAEYDAVCAVMGDRSFDVGLFGGMRPPDGTNPTWLYRSKRWSPLRDGG